MVHLVVLDTLGTSPRRVPALVGRHRPVASLTESRELRPPLPRRLREAVEEQNELTVGRSGRPSIEDELPDGDLQPLELHESDATAGRKRTSRCRTLPAAG